MAFTFNHAELAEVALEKGFLTNERVRECLKIEADGTESGSAETFVDILVKKGYLTEQHLNACKRALAGRDKIAGFEMLEMEQLQGHPGAAEFGVNRSAVGRRSFPDLRPAIQLAFEFRVAQPLDIHPGESSLHSAGRRHADRARPLAQAPSDLPMAALQNPLLS